VTEIPPREHREPGVPPADALLATQTRTAEPIPAIAEPPERGLPPREWMRRNLFDGWFNGALTVLFGLLLAWAVYRIARFVFVDARWEIVERNLVNVLVFHFPRAELWRLWVALFLLSAAFGFGSGVATRLRRAQVEEGRAEATRQPVRLTIRRAAPLLLVVGVFLWFARSPTGTAFVLAIGALGVALHFAGRRVPPRRAKLAPLVALAGIAASYVVITQFGGVHWDRWGGLLLTMFLAIAGILISFPIGVLLALGRRSSFPAVRLVCTAYIELFRGVPLITVLFMAAFVVGFLLPPGMERPTLVTRALIGLVLFTSAYVAEIVRGGLQGVPRGQVEAAQALGLSPVRTTRLIVLPQALRSVIPALVGQFISLFKDTSLVFIIGLTDLLGVMRAITSQPDFIGQGLIVETLLFASFVYWAGSYWMSRESQRLEARLGLGVR
jgi:general L-amino acid transport system permease protein